MATSVKMSSKHQIVVPREARDALGLEPGDRLVVTVREDGVIEMERQPEDLVAELDGLLASRGEGGAGEDAGGGGAAGAGREAPLAGSVDDGLWAELEDG